MTPSKTSSFHATRWTLVAQAGSETTDEETRREALGQLCQIYWTPLYVFARRQGQKPEDAEDSVQSFMAAILEQGVFDRADSEKGRLRSYLIAAFRRFLASQHRAHMAAKRSGGYQKVSIHAEDGERSGRWQVAALETPEQAYHHRWACALLEQSMERLRGEYAERDQSAVFEALCPLLTGNGETAAAAATLKMREGTVRVAVSRMKRRLGLIVKEEVRATLLPGEDLEDELAELMGALGEARG
ncbi:MAG: sigma-70 family RNA polymerase sigma factor [Verrucomicrobiales bacterium]|nr:sigma-70 family RNA polymerase sigma factor [Verrucomicrobiales bacterium]